LSIVSLIDIVNCADVIVLEGGRRFGFMDKTLSGFGFAGQLRRKELEGNVPVELEVPGFVDYALYPATQMFEDLVMRNRLTNEIRHDNSSRGGKHKGHPKPPKEVYQMPCQRAAGAKVVEKQTKVKSEDVGVRPQFQQCGPPQ
jgi:hypothetical protein